MNRTDRRRALQLAMAATITPAIFANRAAGATSARLIAPSEGPMRYTRAIARELVDGALLTVTREFDVSFTRFADGFTLHGEQVRARVEAPDKLADFAALEEARDESGIFPIFLDPFGQILSSQIAQPPEGVLARAVDEALGMLAAQPIDVGEREQFSQFLTALQQAGQHVTAYLPTDLFAPAMRSRHEARDIALPGGVHGKVETLFESDWNAGTGLMRAARRNVLTQVEGNRRTTFENWSLTPA